MINVGVIGAGYWGPNIIRNFTSHPNTQVIMVSDLLESRLQKIKKTYPHIKTTTNTDALLTNNELDLIAICTPVSTHFELAQKAIEQGKHVFIEKPMTSSLEEAKELLKFASKKNVHIFVDHTFLFTPTVQYIKHLLDNDFVGDLLYFDSVRINLGLFQHDVSVVWDLAVHDFSILLYLIDRFPVSISATGAAHLNPKIYDMAYISLEYENNFISHIHVNWLSPVKVRKCLIAGSRKMIVWNDNEADEKLKIYDKGIDVVKDTNQIYELLIQYRTGDMISPRLPNVEALFQEVNHIVKVLKGDEKPISDGLLGMRVVQLLETTSSSIQHKGAPYAIDK